LFTESFVDLQEVLPAVDAGAEAPEPAAAVRPEEDRTRLITVDEEEQEEADRIEEEEQIDRRRIVRLANSIYEVKK
jgi:hypothetical protein